MLKRAMLMVIAALALMALAAGPARAQFGAIEGDLKDENGKPMVGTRIVIDRVDIKGTYNVPEKDTKKGHYYHGGLQPGNYNVSWYKGDQKLDQVMKIRVGLSTERVNFDYKTVRDRQLAAQAGVQLKQPTGPGSEAPQLTKEQRAKIEEALKARDAQKQKMEKLGASFAAGSELLKQSRDQVAMIAKAGIATQPGQPLALTPEVRAQLDTARTQTLEEAVKQFQAAAEADPTQHVVFANMGDACVELAKVKRGDEQQAVFKSAFEAYQKAITLAPEDATYHMNYGSALANAGKMEEANAELGKAAQLDPKAAPMAFFNLGVILVNSGKMKEAQVPLRKSIEADPDYADSWFWLGNSLLADLTLDPKTGKQMPAPGTIEAFEKYLKLKPEGPHAAEAKELITGLGATLQTEIKAEKAAKKAVKKNP